VIEAAIASNGAPSRAHTHTHTHTAAAQLLGIRQFQATNESAIPQVDNSMLSISSGTASGFEMYALRRQWHMTTSSGTKRSESDVPDDERRVSNQQWWPATLHRPHSASSATHSRTAMLRNLTLPLSERSN
jgi:hypothetical protein